MAKTVGGAHPTKRARITEKPLPRSPRTPLATLCVVRARSPDGRAPRGNEKPSPRRRRVSGHIEARRHLSAPGALGGPAATAAEAAAALAAAVAGAVSAGRGEGATPIPTAHEDPALGAAVDRAGRGVVAFDLV